MRGEKVFYAHLVKPISTKMYQYRNRVFDMSLVVIGLKYIEKIIFI